MKTLLIRLLPWLTGSMGLLSGFWQWKLPLVYPWLLMAFGVGYVATLIVIVWKRLGLTECLEKVVPSILALTTLGFSFLIVESYLEHFVLIALLAGIPLLVAELLFLLARDPARYPVSGLSRVNLTLVPITVFFLASTLNGLWVFIRLYWWIPLLAFTLVGSILYAVTVHPTADHGHRGRWAWLGGFIGLHVGVLGLLLPVGMSVHGAMAALVMAAPLRIRRYAYQPVPSKTHAGVEAALAIVIFTGLLIEARWV